MAEKDSKLKALKLTLDKLDKTYGKGSVMKLGDQTIEKVDAIPSGSIGLNLAMGAGSGGKVGGGGRRWKEEKEGRRKEG